MSSASQLKAQWMNPKDILSLLLLVGADVIKTALAQFHGQSFKPVAFSFGWVAYAFMFLLSEAGGFKPMPDPEFRSILVNCTDKRVSENASHLLGRIIHKYDAWRPAQARDALPEEMEGFRFPLFTRAADPLDILVLLKRKPS